MARASFVPLDRPLGVHEGQEIPRPDVVSRIECVMLGVARLEVGMMDNKESATGGNQVEQCALGGCARCACEHGILCGNQVERRG